MSNPNHDKEGKFASGDNAGSTGNHLSYLSAKIQKDSLNNKVDELSKNLQKFPIKVTPENVRASPEFKQAKQEYDKAFSKLRNFNKGFVKTYKKEIQQDRKNRFK